jgi:hypothetical protein
MLSNIIDTWPPSRSVTARRRALVGHVHDVGAGHLLEHLARKMRRAPVLLEAKLSCPGSGLGEARQLRYVSPARRMHTSIFGTIATSVFGGD